MIVKQPPKVYITDHRNSQLVSGEFAKGCGGQQIPAVTLLPGDAVCYGILRGCGEIIEEAKRRNQDFYHIDLGYFKAKHFTGYYRVTKNAFQCSGFGDYPDDRWRKLRIEMQPWQKGGEHVVICPLSRHVGAYLGINTHEWLRDTIQEVSKYTQRPIIIKEKEQNLSIQEAIQGAHAVIAYNSNALVDSIVQGIPVFYTGASCVAPVASNNLAQIENPYYVNDKQRYQWAANLAYNQWTLKEFADGTAWGMLNE